MKTFMISYDLLNVKSADNYRVRVALDNLINSTMDLNYSTGLLFPSWVTLSLPETTLIVIVQDKTTAKGLGIEIANIITDTGCKVGRIFTAEINILDHSLINALDDK